MLLLIVENIGPLEFKEWLFSSRRQFYVGDIFFCRFVWSVTSGHQHTWHFYQCFFSDIIWEKSQKAYFNVGAKGPELGDGNSNNIDNRYDLYHYDFNLYTLINEAFPCLNDIIDRCGSQNGILGTIKMNCKFQGSTDSPVRGPMGPNWFAIFITLLVLVRFGPRWP